ncbi:MAG: hypothetical protein ACPL0A_03275, partial [Candidatus Micrarchaeia archaeon]
NNVMVASIDYLRQSQLYMRATSTALLASLYSYSLNEGYFNPKLECSIGNRITCVDNESRVVTVDTYRRKGGGN